eukprot:3945856-Prymnesium_polylepis.1
MSSAPSAGSEPHAGLRSRVDAIWRARACSVTRGCAPSSFFRILIHRSTGAPGEPQIRGAEGRLTMLSG